MASSKKNLSSVPSGSHPILAKGSVFGIVVSKWHHEITQTLANGALETLKAYGVPESDIFLLEVPGTFELPMGAKILTGRCKPDAIICLGCVIKGDTAHDEYINQAVATGLVQFSLISGIPAIFGVLTTLNEEQARDRAGGKYGNKGIEAAHTAVVMADLKKGGAEKSRIGFNSNK